MTRGQADHRQVGWCLIFLLMGQHAVSFREQMADKDTEMQSDEVRDQRAGRAVNKAGNAAKAPVEPGPYSKVGEAFRSRIRYYKHMGGECATQSIGDFFYQFVKAGCYVTRIAVISRGTEQGEVILKFYYDNNDEKGAKKYYDAADPIPSSVEPVHTVKVSGDTFVGYGARGEFTIMVDTSLQGWTRTNIHQGKANKHLNLWHDEDDMSIQMRETADPEAKLKVVQAETAEAVVSSWQSAFQNLQVLDGCLMRGTCFMHCVRIEGACQPAHWCEEKEGKCEGIIEDEKLWTAWYDIYEETMGKVNALKKSVHNQEQWEETQTEVSNLIDFHENVLKQSAEMRVKSPRFLQSLQMYDAKDFMSEMVKVFIYHRQNSMGVKKAMRTKGCNVEDEVLQKLADTKNPKMSDEEKAETERLFNQLMTDCPYIAEQLAIGKTSAALLSEQQENTAKLREYEKKHGGKVNLDKASLLQTSDIALSGTNSTDVVCVGVCLAIVMFFVAAVVLGLVMILIGRLLCWLGTSIMGAVMSKTKANKDWVDTKFYQCATIFNRVGYILLVVGIIGLVVCWLIGCAIIVVCGSFLESGGTSEGCGFLQTADDSQKMIAGPSNSLAETGSDSQTDSKTGFCLLDAVSPWGMSGNYWMWWSFPDVNILPDYDSSADYDLSRHEAKLDREARENDNWAANNNAEGHGDYQADPDN